VLKWKPWLFALVAGTVLWIAALGIIKMIRSARVTADKVVTLIETRALDSMPVTERESFLLGLAEKMNRMEFEERQKLRMNRSLENLVKSMTEEERLKLFEATLPQGMDELMAALNKMTPEQRKRWVQRGQQELQEVSDRVAAGGEPPGGPVSEEVAQRVTQQGFQSYLENASSETKMDLAPLMEQIQLNLQGLKGP